MYNMQQMKKLFQQIQVVRVPRHRLATFGSSRIHYQLVTDVPGLPDRSKLRTGIVTAQKPAIITATSVTEQFHGFGEDVQDYVDTLVKQYGKAFRGLEYNFQNEPIDTKIELSSPETFIQSLSRKFDRSETYDTAIIRGSDKMWELAIMKFIVEETLSSFAVNLQELQDRGFFDDEDRERKRQKREINNLFRAAKTDRTAIPVLGTKLKQYGLFEHYQDAFFRLVHP